RIDESDQSEESDRTEHHGDSGRVRQYHSPADQRGDERARSAADPVGRAVQFLTKKRWSRPRQLAPSRSEQRQWEPVATVAFFPQFVQDLIRRGGGQLRAASKNPDTVFFA